VTWEFYPATTMFSTYAEEWDRLNAQLYDSHPLFDSRFVGPLLDYFGSGKEKLCICRVNGVIEGALILRPSGAGRWASFLPSQAQVAPVLLSDASRLGALLRELPGFAWTIEFLAIDPRYSPDFSRLNLEKIVSPHAHTIGIDRGIRFGDYWKGRPKNLQANVRRYSNRAEREAGVPVISNVTTPQDVAAGVGRFGELERTGWKAATGTAVSVENGQFGFYSEVLRRFALTNQAEIAELVIGGQLAASRLTIGNTRMVVILKTAYEESLGRFAPSRLLLYRLLENYLTNDAEKAIEFYTNATLDQNEWSTYGLAIQHIQVFKGDAYAVAFSILKVALRLLRSAENRRALSETLVLTKQVRSCRNLEEFASENYDLQEFAPKDNIEVSIDWFDLLQKQVYPNDPSIRYYFIADHDKPTTLLPLRLTTKGWVRTVESLSNYYTSLYTPLASKDSDPFVLRHLLASATRDHGGAHVMRFAPMDPESVAYKGILNELRAIGWIPFRFFSFGNWFLKIEGGWEDYLRKRSANLRSSIKRRNREFVAQGGALEIVSGSESLEAAIATFQEVYSASWKKPEPYPEFVSSLIRMLAAKGMLRLGIARLQGRPIAAQLWITGQCKASIYKVAYHHAYASLSPGTVLTSYMLRHVIDQDSVREVDFLIGDDEYKKIWMSHRRERWGIVAFNPRTVIGCILLLKEVAGRTAKATGQRLGATLSSAQSSITAMTRRPDFVRNARAYFSNAQRDGIMVWTILPIEKFAEYSAQWDTLIRSRPGAPFLESAFLQPLLNVFGTGGERLCVLQENGRLRAAAILQRGRKAIWQTFQPSQLPLGAWITDGHVDLNAACNSLMLQLPGVTLALGVSQVDPRLQKRPADAPKLRAQDYIATAWVDIDSSFDAYWEARGKNLKQNTRKQRNKLQTDGVDPRIECIETPELVAKAIEDYGQLESAGWKGADGTAVAPRNDQGRFYRSMLENYCAQGRGRIYRYWFGDKVVAMDLCIHDELVLVILKTAYDESYKLVSPSTLMRQDQFQQLFAEQKFQRIEFFGKVMEWHTRWTSQSRTIYHATAYRWAWLKELHARRASARPSQTPVAPAES
jgi:CelD/BcsL family acetyltransferase involved in cellulose biosynthesis